MEAQGQDNRAQQLPEEVFALLRQGVNEGVFPGAAAAIAQGLAAERKEWLGCWGSAALLPEPAPLTLATCFDLASLTKPLATTLAILALVEAGTIGLEEPLADLLQRTVPEDKEKIRLAQLLSHSSGLAAHRPYYRQVKEIAPAARREAMERAILAEPLEAEPGSKAIYSDLGFMLLGWIVEAQSGTPLDSFVRERIYRPLGLAEALFFRPLAVAGGREECFAATEQCPWRGRVLRGEVSDDNTHILGGVAGQAGLFGHVAAVLRLVCTLLDCWQGRATHPAFSRATLSAFLVKEGSVAASTWALGFDTPSPVGSSAGRFFSPQSVGHLGFTGTSFWLDPTRDLAVVLLSNRVHPSRENSGIKAFRPRFHDTVSAALSPPGNTPAHCLTRTR